MVEFRNTPPRASIGDRDSTELLEDLCIALREVAVRDGWLPKSEEVQASVREALAIATELDSRQVAPTERLDRLSQETGWLMGHLLEECRHFPRVLPRVRELDGIRRHLRCRYCKSAERPEDDVKLAACDACLRRVVRSFESLEPVVGTVLFRTFNSGWRCEHADSDTVLLGVDWYEDGLCGPGKCKRCLDNDLAGREAHVERAR